MINQPTNESRFSNLGLQFLELEKKELAGELHDNIASKLAIIRLMLLREKENLSEVINLLDHTIKSVRTISHNLYSFSFEHICILEAIKDFVSPLHGIIKVEIECSDKDSLIMKHAVKLNLFRVFQEVIQNILKHAKASKINIKLDVTNTVLNLSIGDNGQGIINTSPNNIGMGIESITYRAKAINATYRIVSVKNHGTKFKISVPL